MMYHDGRRLPLVSRRQTFHRRSGYVHRTPFRLGSDHFKTYISGSVGIRLLGASSTSG